MNSTKYDFAANLSFKDFIHVGINELVGFKKDQDFKVLAE